MAFKLNNDTSHTLRASAYDRGGWRAPVTFAPGGWAVFAPEVERTEHSVRIDVLTAQGWVNVYSGTNGSRVYTRVVEAVESNGNIYLYWWDEPPGCRDKPLNPLVGGSTCLQPSG